MTRHRVIDDAMTRCLQDSKKSLSLVVEYKVLSFNKL